MAIKKSIFQQNLMKIAVKVKIFQLYGYVLSYLNSKKV